MLNLRNRETVCQARRGSPLPFYTGKTAFRHRNTLRKDWNILEPDSWGNHGSLKNALRMGMRRLHAAGDAGAGGGAGGPRPPKRIAGDGPGEEGPRSDGSQHLLAGHAYWLMLALALGMLTTVARPKPVAAAVAAAAAAGAPAATAMPASSAQGIQAQSSVEGTWGASAAALPSSETNMLASEDIARLKRLQRELFAGMLEVRQRLDDLEPKEEEDLFIPHEGAGVTPRPKRLSHTARYRSRAQLSGCIEAAALLPWCQGGDASAAGSDDADIGVSSGPDTQLLLQALWPSKQQSLTAKLGLHKPAASSVATGTLQGPAGLHIQQLLLRREQGPVRLLLAPLGGSIESIARKLNPSAEFGLTRAMRQGHDLHMATESGSGAAATWIMGAVSASAGHFMSGDLDRARHHSVAQVSCHSSRRLAASVVLSSTALPAAAAHMPAMEGSNFLEASLARANSRSGPAPAGSGAPRSLMAPMGGTGPALPGLSSLAAGRSSMLAGGHSFPSRPASVSSLSMHKRPDSMEVEAGSTWSPNSRTAPDAFSTSLEAPSDLPAGGQRIGRVGAALTVAVGEAAVLSAWHMSGTDKSTGGTGVRVSTTPSDGGVVLAALVCWPSRSSVGSWSGRVDEQPSRGGHPTVCEVSASVPVADGFCLQPGVVVTHQRGGRSTVALAVQSSWRF